MIYPKHPYSSKSIHKHGKNSICKNHQKSTTIPTKSNLKVLSQDTKQTYPKQSESPTHVFFPGWSFANHVGTTLVPRMGSAEQCLKFQRLTEVAEKRGLYTGLVTVIYMDGWMF